MASVARPDPREPKQTPAFIYRLEQACNQSAITVEHHIMLTPEIKDRSNLKLAIHTMAHPDALRSGATPFTMLAEGAAYAAACLVVPEESGDEDGALSDLRLRVGEQLQAYEEQKKMLEMHLRQLEDHVRYMYVAEMERRTARD